MKSIGVGRQAEVFEKDGQALKIYNDWVSAEQIQYEADVSKKVAEVYSSAPKFFGMEQQGGRTILKFELVKGNILTAVMSRNLLQLKKYSQKFGKLHSEMHKKTVPGIRTAADKFEKSLLHYNSIDSDRLNKLLDFLKKSKVESLCHGDLHPENVMVDENDTMRVIDWVDSYSGDPLSDVARTYYLLTRGTPPGKKTLFIQLVEKQAKKIIAREYLKAYFGDRPIPVKELEMWGLIIQINRYAEGIKEEKALLQKSIAAEVNKLR